jgi:CRP-like cAMP-binding protein
MYFIDQGLVEVLASDEVTPLAYMSIGGYFGEIGCCLLGKRSVTVRTRATSILF